MVFIQRVACPVVSGSPPLPVPHKPAPPGGRVAQPPAVGPDPSRRWTSSRAVMPSGPPRDIAARPGLDPGRDLCVVRRHVRYIDSKPGIVSDDDFDERIVRGTELAAPEDTTREDILKEAGYEQTYDVDEINSRMATPEEVERLSRGRSQAVAEHTRTGYTAQDKAVRVMVSIIPGDLLVLRYVILI